MQPQEHSSPAGISTTSLPHPQSVRASIDCTIPGSESTVDDTPLSEVSQASPGSARDPSHEHCSFRCPVCDESRYTLEALSTHMWANRHGRFGSVETTCHRQSVSSATVSLTPANISDTSLTTPQVLSSTPRTSTMALDVSVPSMAVPSVVTTLHVPTSGTASAIAAAQTAALPTGLQNGMTIPISTTLPDSALTQNLQTPQRRGSTFCVSCQQWYQSRKSLMEHMSVCFGSSQQPSSKKFAGLEEYVKVR